jgi:hypothetical protein
MSRKQVYEMLKGNSETKKEWFSTNSSMERKLLMAGNDSTNEILWECSVSAR